MDESRITLPTRVPGSKSATLRALMLAAQVGGTIRNPNQGQDVTHFVAAIQEMGAETTLGDPITVHKPIQHGAQVNAGNSGTGARFLLCLMAQFGGSVSGDESLHGRPIGKLAQNLGIPDAWPATLTKPLPSHFDFMGDVTSQGTSAAILSAPLQHARGMIRHARASTPYIELTCKMAEDAGMKLQHDALMTRWSIPQKARVDVTIHADWSHAALILATAAIMNRRHAIEDLRPDGQGDARIVADLAQWHRGRRSWDVTHNPDLFPAYLLLAIGGQGQSKIMGLDRLQYKESHRLEVACEMLRAMGVRFDLQQDLIITGGVSANGALDPRGDHRMFMLAHILDQLFDCPVIAADPDVSWPGFLEALGAH